MNFILCKEKNPNKFCGSSSLESLLWRDKHQKECYQYVSWTVQAWRYTCLGQMSSFWEHNALAVVASESRDSLFPESICPCLDPRLLLLFLYWSCLKGEYELQQIPNTLESISEWCRTSEASEHRLGEAHCPCNNSINPCHVLPSFPKSILAALLLETWRVFHYSLPPPSWDPTPTSFLNLLLNPLLPFVHLDWTLTLALFT